MSDSSRPHGLQPTRLLHPWDFPGKSTGVGCHFLLQCMKVKSESEAAQSCLTLSDPMDCSLPGSSVHGIFQARVLEWGAIAFSMTNTNGIKYILGRKHMFDSNAKTERLCVCVCSGFACLAGAWNVSCELLKGHRHLAPCDSGRSPRVGI